jgi:polar amino acid transport system substrate-binding protein
VVDSPPWLIGDATTGKWTGPGNDVAAAVAKKLGVKIDYVTTTFGTFVAGLQANQFDMFVAPANATPARLAVVDMTPYSVDGTCYAVKQSNTTINALADLNSPNVTFGFFQGIATTDQVKAQYPMAKSVTRQAVAGSPGDIQSVESGLATAAPFDSVFATVVASQFPDLKVVPPVATCLATPDLVIPTAVAYSKDPGFDQVVKQITQQITPQIQADYAKYSSSQYLGQIPG